MGRIIHLLRHGSHQEVGKVLSGRSEIALDEAGQTDAQAAAILLRNSPIVSIYSSPRRRAWETALPLAKSRAIEVRCAEALDEIDFGRFTGRSFEELDADPDWTRWNVERDRARCPDGETMAEAVARAWTFLASLAAEATPAVCVTHCDIIRGVVADRIGMGIGRIFALDCDPGSITTLAIDDDEVRLVALNRRSRQ